MSLIEGFKKAIGRPERNKYKQRVKDEEASRKTFEQSDYEALTQEIEHQRQIEVQVAELEAKLAALKAEASASRRLTELHSERAQEIHETKALGMEKLKKLESFSALTSSFFQNILIRWNLKRVNSVETKREEIQRELDEAERLRNEAHQRRVAEIANKERINALLLAMRQGGGLVAGAGGAQGRRKGAKSTP